MTESDGRLPLLEPGEFPPPSATVQVDFGAQSHRGRSRLVNEDHYLILRLGRHQETLMTSLPDDAIAARFDEYGYAMVVADGMSGTGAGEAASHLAIATLVFLVRQFGKWMLRVDDAAAQDIMARAERFYRHVDATVMHQRDQGMVRTDRTTLTATFGSGHDLFFAHIGHSRAYLYRGGDLMRLTRDHTIGRNQSKTVPTAPLVDVSVSAKDLKHILTDTIGMNSPYGPTIDLERIQLEDHDRVLVCTNGLTDSVDEEMIGQILATDQSAGLQCQALVDSAMASGGNDDVTALVARYCFPG
jgi:serine/threonine protein phosphatase PrpC